LCGFAVKQVFSEMDFLGWYTTGDTPTDKDLEVHRQFVEYNESPVFLKLNPTASVGGDLPITVYESVIDLVGGEATMLFIDLPYTLATEEAERIGVDHVARMTASETGESSLGRWKLSQIFCLKHEKINCVHFFLLSGFKMSLTIFKFIFCKV
jgi:hypothetical protein